MLPFQHLVLRLFSFLVLSQANALSKESSTLTKDTLKKWAESRSACTFIVDCYSVTIRSPSCDTGRLARRGPDYILALVVRDCTGRYHENSGIQWQFVYPRKPPGRLTRCRNKQSCALYGEHLIPGQKYHIQASIWIPRAQNNLNLTFELVSHTGGGRRLYSTRKIVARKGVEDRFIGFVHKSGETIHHASRHVNRRQKDFLPHDIPRRHRRNWIKRKRYSKHQRRKVHILKKLSTPLQRHDRKYRSLPRPNNRQNNYVAKVNRRSKRNSYISIELADGNKQNDKERAGSVQDLRARSHKRKHAKVRKGEIHKSNSTKKQGETLRKDGFLRSKDSKNRSMQRKKKLFRRKSKQEKKTVKEGKYSRNKKGAKSESKKGEKSNRTPIKKTFRKGKYSRNKKGAKSKSKSRQGKQKHFRRKSKREKKDLRGKRNIQGKYSRNEKGAKSKSKNVGKSNRTSIKKNFRKRKYSKSKKGAKIKGKNGRGKNTIRKAKHSRSKKGEKSKNRQRKKTYRKGKYSRSKKGTKSKNQNRQRKKTEREREHPKRKKGMKNKSQTKGRNKDLKEKKQSRSKKQEKIKSNSINKPERKVSTKHKHSSSNKGTKFKHKTTDRQGDKNLKRKHADSQSSTKSKSNFEETKFFVHLKRKYNKGNYSKTSKRKVKKGKIRKTPRKSKNQKPSKKKFGIDQKLAGNGNKLSGAISINKFLNLQSLNATNITDMKNQLVYSVLKAKGSIIGSSNTTVPVMDTPSKITHNSTINRNGTNELILIMLRKDISKLLNMFNLSRSEIKYLEQMLKEKSKQIKGNSKEAKFGNVQSKRAFDEVLQKFYNMSYHASRKAIKNELGTIQKHMALIQKHMKKFQAWGPWTKWTACPKSCSSGQGFKMRERKCILKKGCFGKSTEFAPCQTDCKEYERWTSWTNWSTCSHSCGTGITIRKRLCKLTGRRCEGQGYQIEPCVISPTCPAVPRALALPKRQEDVPQNWGQWSECSVSCGIGRVFRQKYCSKEESRYCRGPVKQQTRACVMDSCNTGAKREQVQILEGSDAVLHCSLRYATHGLLYWVTPFGKKISKQAVRKRLLVVNDKLLIRETQRKDKGVYHCVTKYGRTADIEMDVLWCGLDLCQNGGTCVKSRPRLHPHHRRSKCVCQDGFMGMFCEQEKPVAFFYMILVSVTTLVSAMVLMTIIIILVCRRRKIRKLKMKMKSKGPEYRREGYQKLPTDDRDHNVSIVSNNDNSLMEIKEEDFKHFKKQNSYNMYKSGQDADGERQNFNVDQVDDDRYISVKKEQGRQRVDMDQASDERYLSMEKERGRMPEPSLSLEMKAHHIQPQCDYVEDYPTDPMDGYFIEDFPEYEVPNPSENPTEWDRIYDTVEQEEHFYENYMKENENKGDNLNTVDNNAVSMNKENSPVVPRRKSVNFSVIYDYPAVSDVNKTEDLKGDGYNTDDLYLDFSEVSSPEGHKQGILRGSMSDAHSQGRQLQKSSPSVGSTEENDRSNQSNRLNQSNVSRKLSFEEPEYSSVKKRPKGTHAVKETINEMDRKLVNNEEQDLFGMEQNEIVGNDEDNMRLVHRRTSSENGSTIVCDLTNNMDRKPRNNEQDLSSMEQNGIVGNDEDNMRLVHRRTSSKNGSTIVCDLTNNMDRKPQNNAEQDLSSMEKNEIVGNDDDNMRLVHRKTYCNSGSTVVCDLTNYMELDVNEGLCYRSPNRPMTFNSSQASEYRDKGARYMSPIKDKLTTPKRSNWSPTKETNNDGLHTQSYQVTEAMTIGGDVGNSQYLTSTPKKDESTANKYEQVLVDEEVSFRHKNSYPTRKIPNNSEREILSSEDLDGLFQCIVQEADDTDQEVDINENQHQRTLSPIQEDDDDDGYTAAGEEEISASFKSISPSISEGRQPQEDKNNQSLHDTVPELNLDQVLNQIPEQEKTVVYISDQYSGSGSDGTDIVANFESPPISYFSPEQ